MSNDRINIPTGVEENPMKTPMNAPIDAPPSHPIIHDITFEIYDDDDEILFQDKWSEKQKSKQIFREFDICEKKRNAYNRFVGNM